jgi:uncharacterized membrane protein
MTASGCVATTSAGIQHLSGMLALWPTVVFACTVCLWHPLQLYVTITILAYAAPRWLHNWLSFYVNVSNAAFMWVSAIDFSAAAAGLNYELCSQVAGCTDG